MSQRLLLLVHDLSVKFGDNVNTRIRPLWIASKNYVHFHYSQVKDYVEAQLLDLGILDHTLPIEAWLPNKDRNAGLFLSSLIINLMGLGLPILLLQIYDRIIPNDALETLYILCSAIAVAILLECLLKILRSHVSTWADAKCNYLKAKRAFTHILTSDVLSVERQGAGIHLERLNSLEHLRDFLGGQALPLLIDLPFVVIFFSVMLLISPILTLIPLSLIVIMALFSSKHAARMYGVLKKRSAENQEKINFLMELLSGIHTVKAFGMEAQMLRRYERLQQTTAYDDTVVATIQAENVRFASLISQVNVLLISSVGAALVMTHDLTLGGLAACTLLSGRIMIPLSKAIGLYGRLQNIRVARAHEAAILSLPNESNHHANRFEIDEGKIELRNLGFRFTKDSPWIFRNLNLMISPGEMIGLTSETQSGKSILLALIAGLYKPSEGEIRVDDVDIAYIDKIYYRESIGFIPQNGVLFQGSVLENITGFKHGEVFDEVKKLTTDLGLAPVIDEMPHGYQTELGLGAVDSVSRGIKQRIVIARGLMHHPKLVIFDEANTAMDISSDTKLNQYLEANKKRWTCILVSHRPSFLRLADRIYKLDAGKLIELPKTAPEVPNAK